MSARLIRSDSSRTFLGITPQCGDQPAFRNSWPGDEFSRTIFAIPLAIICRLHLSEAFTDHHTHPKLIANMHVIDTHNAQP